MSTVRRVILLGIAFAFFFCVVTETDAQRRRGGGGSGGQTREAKAPYEAYEAKGLFATGLTPAFPGGVICPSISSPYGSLTRYDGSPRSNEHHGYHNGMDITLGTGTPLLAVADSTVINKGAGGQLVGNFVWLHLAPEATGLAIHIFARYQHLDEQSPLNVGDKVKAGEPVGLGGSTGTEGGHFGSAGYSHLHLVFYTGPSGDFRVEGSKIRPRSLNYLDPMALYLDKSLGALTNHALRDLPSEKKMVRVPVRTQAGQTIPRGAKLVWPLACK